MRATYFSSDVLCWKFLCEKPILDQYVCMQTLCVLCMRKNILIGLLQNHLRDLHWSLRWRHIGRDDVSNHQPHDCLLIRSFRRRSKKTSKLRVTGQFTNRYFITIWMYTDPLLKNVDQMCWSWRHNWKIFVPYSMWCFPYPFMISDSPAYFVKRKFLLNCIMNIDIGVGAFNIKL